MHKLANDGRFDGTQHSTSFTIYTVQDLVEQNRWQVLPQLAECHHTPAHRPTKLVRATLENVND